MYKPPRQQRKSQKPLASSASATRNRQAADVASAPKASVANAPGDGDGKLEAKRGRKPIPEEQKRDVMIRVMVTEADFKRFQRAAEKDARSLSTWFRQLAIHATERG